MVRFLDILVKFKLISKTVMGRESLPYLLRWNLLDLGFISFKVHKILRSDPECMHDHSWAFISIILKGAYFEKSAIWGKRVDPNLYKKTGEDYVYPSSYFKERFSVGNIRYRPAKYIHALELISVIDPYSDGSNEYGFVSIFKPVWSLMITFKKIRPWGVWTKGGWVEGGEFERRWETGDDFSLICD